MKYVHSLLRATLRRNAPPRPKRTTTSVGEDNGIATDAATRTLCVTKLVEDHVRIGAKANVQMCDSVRTRSRRA